MATTFNDAPTQTVKVDGTDFAYRVIGDAGGLPIVLLHHFTGVLDDWDPAVIDGLAQQRRVIIFDNRGGADDPIGEIGTVHFHCLSRGIVERGRHVDFLSSLEG